MSDPYAGQIKNTLGDISCGTQKWVCRYKLMLVADTDTKNGSISFWSLINFNEE